MSPARGHARAEGGGDGEGEGGDGDGDVEAEDGAEVAVGRRRQVVGILVRLHRLVGASVRTDLGTRAQMLQLGIMLHSLVIGLTLAITTGSEFSKPPHSLTLHPTDARTQPRSSSP